MAKKTASKTKAKKQLSQRDQQKNAMSKAKKEVTTFGLGGTSGVSKRSPTGKRVLN